MMNRRKERIRYRIVKLLLVLCAGLLGLLWIPGEEADPERTVSATTVREINSTEEYYTMLADQIYRREALEYYTVRNRSLGKQIVHSDLHGFQAHDNLSDPLKSGCYLCYYTQTVYFTYSGTQLQILIKYPYTKEEMDAHFNKMDRLAEELKGKDDYETVKNVHDYLIRNFDYDYSTSMVNHTDIDGFRDGKMVCSGYGLATYYLLNRVGIRTKIITGSDKPENATESNHMWNMVCVDGKWYNLDVTWDDPGGTKISYTYFLKSDADFPSHRRLGIYETEYYDNLVSKESYEMPVSTSYTWLIVVLAVILFLIILSMSRGRNKEPEEYQGYVVEDPRFGEGTFGNGGPAWDAGQRQVRFDAGQGSPWDTMSQRKQESGYDPRQSWDEDIRRMEQSRGEAYGKERLYDRELRGGRGEGGGMDAAYRTGQGNDPYHDAGRDPMGDGPSEP